VIALAEYARGRRRRERRDLHTRCCAIVSASVVKTRVATITAPAGARSILLTRLRKLEALETYVLALD